VWTALALAIVLAVSGCDYAPVPLKLDAPTAPTTTPPPPAPPPSPQPDPQPSPQPPPPHPSGRRIRLLFIGNSLTYVNDLPGMVASLSRAAGDSVPIETASVTFGGYSLEDHLAQGDAARAIQQGGWDIVALQQGPSTLDESRVNLIDYTQRFATIIRDAGARPALYGVWPERDRLYALDAGIESYRLAAEAVDGLLFPAGLAWKDAWQVDGWLPLYGPDGFHPSVLGTYTAAIVVYAVVRGTTPVGLPFAFDVNGGRVDLDAAQAHAVQLAAAQAIGTGAETAAVRGAAGAR